jgi:tetratricopeptide (TPR) repeat protein
MDPHRVQTYLTASFWLRTALNQPKEAEEFLREGLRANPDSFEMLLELSYVYDFSRKDARAARRLCELALQKWQKQEADGLKPSPKAEVEILDGMVRADRQLGDLPNLLADLEALKAISPGKEAIQRSIDETRAALAAPGQK